MACVLHTDRARVWTHPDPEDPDMPTRSLLPLALALAGCHQAAPSDGGSEHTAGHLTTMTYGHDDTDSTDSTDTTDCSGPVAPPELMVHLTHGGVDLPQARVRAWYLDQLDGEPVVCLGDGGGRYHCPADVTRPVYVEAQHPLAHTDGRTIELVRTDCGWPDSEVFLDLAPADCLLEAWHAVEVSLVDPGGAPSPASAQLRWERLDSVASGACTETLDSHWLCAEGQLGLIEVVVDSGGIEQARELVDVEASACRVDPVSLTVELTAGPQEG